MALSDAQPATPVAVEMDSPRIRPFQWTLIVLIMAINVALKAPNLGHETLKPMDESFHAVVARNLLYDPFKPTLIRDPYLPYDPSDWLANHVWLHKPILPLWQIALSFKVFGVDTLALRLPSLILSTLAVLLTFLIAKRVYDPWIGLIAAMIQAIVPAIGMLVHGYVFSDAIDISLLFWSELSIFLMLSSRKGAMLGSGCAGGAAFLSKTFPALYVLAPLALLILSQRTGRGRKLLVWMIGFLLIAAPWNIYTAIRFPTEFKAEHGLILQHLSADVENWASPWDRLWFQHLPGGLYLFWTTSLIGAIMLSIRAIQLKQWTWLLAPIWVAAVLIPFTLATSKTPSASLIAWPGLMICAGFLIVRACRGFSFEFIVAMTMLLLAVVFSGKFIHKGWGMTQPCEVMWEAQWILWHLCAGILVIAIGLSLDQRIPDSWWSMAIPIALLLCLATRTGMVAWKVQTLKNPGSSFVEMGRWIRENLPSDAVVFVKERSKFEHLSLMFRADRACYPHVSNESTKYGNRPLYLVRDEQAHDAAFQADGRWLYSINQVQK